VQWFVLDCGTVIQKNWVFIWHCFKILAISTTLYCLWCSKGTL